MAEADKDGRIAQWFRDRHTILGMELHNALDVAREGFGATLDAAMSAEQGGRCERCEVTFSGSTPTLAWLGRHAHGTKTTGYFRTWRTIG